MRDNGIVQTIAWIVGIAFAVAFVATARGGTFGVGGTAMPQIRIPGGTASATFVQPLASGEVIVAGTAAGPLGNTMFSARFTAAGALDPTYGNEGVAYVPMPGDLVQITGNAAVLDGANRLVIVGQGSPVQNYGAAGMVVAARILADGTLDTSFGTAGLFRFALPLYNSGLTASAVALDSQARIVIAGGAQSSSFGLSGFLALRLTAAGALDPTLDGAGYRVVTLSPYASGATSVGIAAGDAIVLAGSDDPLNAPFAIVRLVDNGTRDAGFGTAGVMHLPQGGPLALDASGNVLVGLTVWDGTPKFALTRVTAAGSIDGAFGTGGTLTIIVPGLVSAQMLANVAIDHAGRTVLSVYGLSQLGPAMALVRLSSSGQADAAFGNAGFRIVELGQGIAQAPFALGIGASDDIAVSSGLVPDSFIVVGRVDATGTLIGAFDGDGVAAAQLGTRRLTLTSLARQADGKPVLAGYASEPGLIANFVVARLTTGGQLDPSFAGKGYRFIEIAGGTFTNDVALALDGSGRAVVAQHDYAWHFIVARLLSDGSLDAGFNGGAPLYVDDPLVLATSGSNALGVAVDGPGNVFLFGQNIVRLTPAGLHDPAFGTGGSVVPPIAVLQYGRIPLAVDSAGRLLVGGSGTRAGELDVARLATNGALDATFGAAGIAAVYSDASAPWVSRGLVLDSAGRIVVGALASNYPQPAAVVARLSAAGQVDKTFGAAGFTLLPVDMIEPRSIALDGGDRILVTGAGATTRVRAGGGVDATFNGGYAMATFPPSDFLPLNTVGVIGDASGAYVGGASARTFTVVKLFDGVPTQLGFVAINGHRNVRAGTPFDVVIAAQDGAGNAQPVATATTVTFSRDDGPDTVVGGHACTIPSGEAFCTVQGVVLSATTYYTTFKAAATAGPSLAPGRQQVFVDPAVAVVTITAHAPNPSPQYAPITVTVAVAGSFTAPTGSLYVDDGFESCGITLPQTSCVLTPSFFGALALQAHYLGDSVYGFADSERIAHTVNVTRVGIPIGPPGENVQDAPAGGGAGAEPIPVNGPGELAVLVLLLMASVAWRPRQSRSSRPVSLMKRSSRFAGRCR